MKVIKINDWLFKFPWIITVGIFFFWEYIQTYFLSKYLCLGGSLPPSWWKMLTW